MKKTVLILGSVLGLLVLIGAARAIRAKRPDAIID